MAYPQSIAHCPSEETSLGEQVIDNQITITLIDEALKGLVSLGRTDLPPTLAIDLARQMYPWLDHLLNKLQTESQDIAHARIDTLFIEGLDLVDNPNPPAMRGIPKDDPEYQYMRQRLREETYATT